MAWIVTDQFSWMTYIALQLFLREKIKEKEDGERSGVKRLFKGGNQFKYFSQREAIIRGRRLIEGQLLFQEIQYLETDMQPSVYNL